MSEKIQSISVICPVPYGMLLARLELELRSLSPESGVLFTKKALTLGRKIMYDFLLMIYSVTQ